MRFRFLIPLILYSLFNAPSASAHAFGQLYTLPIPLWLYLYGAGAALIISFVLIGFFAKEKTHFSLPKPQIKLNSSVIFLFRVISIALLILTVLTGFFGTQSQLQNFAPNFFWIIFLLGFTYLTAIVGNIWDTINPFKIIASLLPRSKPVLKYPQNFGVIPALIFYFLLIWLELFSGGLAAKPIILSQLLITYTIIMFLGSLVFGIEDWFKYGDFFSVFFGLFSKISLLGRSNLLEERPKNLSLLIFILFMLSSTAFDGFRGTIVYFRYFYSFNPMILLVFSLILFLTFYSVAIFLMKVITKTNRSIKNLSLDFAFSLIPIALAYNIAHYYTLLITQGQQIIPLLSDPFNEGLNLFGTADYQINVGIVNAGFVWNSEVIVIILGHVIAVVLAHLIALKIFPGKQALISQLPMLILMVVFTITGLWILSQPLTIGG